MNKNNIQNRVAVIDLGTNTLKLLIADKNGDDWNYIQDLSIPCRLGEGLKKRKRLSPQAKQRTLDALDKALAACEVCKAGRYYPIATEAFRLAENGEEFRLKIKKELGLDFQILTGEEEAELSSKSLQHDFPNTWENIFIIDIGGGSTEISAKFEVRNTKYTEQRSFPLGCVVLKEEYLHSDPPSEEELSSLRNHVRAMINEIPSPEESISCYGIGGTISTLGSIYLGEYKAEKIHGMQLSLNQIEDISNHLNSLTIPERREIPGMVMGREDVLPAGAVVLLEMMSHFHAESVTISKHGIRYGYLYKI
jgi:exopolyphosphatase / guanosine-5'-triphosphate,3'-diphosphate pyrophosphatase